MQASDELYKVNKDDILRQQARARADAEFWEKVHNARMEKMQEELEKNKKELSKKNAIISEKNSVISEKDNEIKRLKEQLAQKSWYRSVNFKTIINKTTESRSAAAVPYPPYAERERYFRRNILYATEMRPWLILEAVAERINQGLIGVLGVMEFLRKYRSLSANTA